MSLSLDDVRVMVEWEMTKHGLIPEWQFEFGNALTQAGCCSYKHKKITISRHLVKTWTKMEIHDTILHEIAHALVGGFHGHDNVWREMAQSIGGTGNTYHDHVFSSPKYLVTCECGRAQLPRYRVTWRLMALSKRICKYCNGTEKQIFALSSDGNFL